MTIAPPLLVLGHHRSGTNFLAEVLQRHPAVKCATEPFSMQTAFFREHDLVPWAADDYDQAVLHRTLHDRPAVVLLLQELKKWLMGSSPAAIRGFKETILFEKLPWLGRFLPGLRVVFLVRDPRAIVASVLAVPERNELWNYPAAIGGYLSSAHPQNCSTVPSDPAELCAASIKIRWDLASEHLAGFESMTLRLEDLLFEPIGSLKSVMGFLGLEPSHDQVSFIKESHQRTKGGRYSSFRSPSGVLGRWRTALDDQQIANIEELLRDHLVSHGYL